jgi:cytochrome c peroxidase
MKIVSTILVALAAIIIYSCAVGSHKKNNAADIVSLGRYLFFDRRLSVNSTRSCATCHNPQFAFTDGYKRSLGAYADLHQRNTQPLFNLQYYKYLTAADSTVHNTLQQMDNPLFNIHPVEMGYGLDTITILNTLQADLGYQQLFAAAFPSATKITLQHIKIAINSFINTITSNNTPYDKYIAGDSNAITASQQKGMNLFFSKALNCSACHAGVNFSSPQITSSNGDTIFYFNTGLYNVDSAGSYPLYDQGLYAATKNKKDMGAYRVPTLRNLAFTAPYFHDGSAATLTDVIENYATGGRIIATGINKGNGSANPYKHPLVKGFKLSAEEKTQLIDFLMTLTDSSIITNPLWQNPFATDETKKK